MPDVPEASKIESSKDAGSPHTKRYAKAGNQEGTRIAAAGWSAVGALWTPGRIPIREAATVVTVPIHLCQCPVTEM
jgi:hypothetical protein